MRKKMKSLVALAICSAVVLGSFAGCSKSKDAGTKDTKVLKVTMGLGEEEWKVMKEDVFPAFEKANNCKIEAVQVEAKDVVTKLEAMKKADKMEIDLITQDNMALAPLVEKGLVEDLSSYKDKIPSAVIPSLVKVGEFDGKLYFLPYRPNVEINFYNEKKFADAGVKVPTTWDELLSAAKAFKSKEGIGRISIKGTLDGNTTVQLFEFIRQAGGDPMVLNDEGSIKAYTFLKELWPYLSPDSPKADWNTTNGFLAKESIYYGANWPFGVNVIVKDAGKKEVKANAGFSGPVKASKVLGGEVIGITKGSKEKDLAFKFAEYLVSKDVQEKLVSKLAWPSARTDAYGTVEDWQKPYFAAINDALKVAEARPNVTYWADVEKATNDALRDIVINNKDVKETLNKYHDVIEKAKK